MTKLEAKDVVKYFKHDSHQLKALGGVNLEIEDGEFTTACAQACPANAITFGRIDNEESLVSQLAKLDRGTKHLDELNTLPRVTYLKEG